MKKLGVCNYYMDGADIGDDTNANAIGLLLVILARQEAWVRSSIVSADELGAKLLLRICFRSSLTGHLAAHNLSANCSYALACSVRSNCAQASASNV